MGHSLFCQEARSIIYISGPYEIYPAIESGWREEKKKRETVKKEEAKTELCCILTKLAIRCDTKDLKVI